MSGYAAYWHGDPGHFVDLVNTASVLGAPTIRLGATGFASLVGRNVSNLRRALDVAEAAGIPLSLSYLPAAFDATARLVREVGHPSLRLCWRSRWGWSGGATATPFDKLRFCVPNVHLGELTRAGERHIPEATARARILHAAPGHDRYVVFDAAPHGASLLRASQIARLASSAPSF